jgi:hypothetical protein
MGDWLFLDIIEEKVKQIQTCFRSFFPPVKRYRVTENPDEPGYFLEEIKDDDDS